MQVYAGVAGIALGRVDLQNHFGGASAFKIFTIDEVLKEAMEYVSPKK